MPKLDSVQQKIVPYLWFDHQAEEAVHFYTSIFGNGKIGRITRYGETVAAVAGQPVGAVMTVDFQIEGMEFVGLNGGPAFEFTPAISFFVNCDSEEEIDHLWEQLAAGGEVLMPFDSYPFSQKFGWLNDRFGVSWQLNLAPAAQKIVPCLLFVGDQAGRAEEAINLYTSLFEEGTVDRLERYGNVEGEPADNVMHARFSLDGEAFIAMDSSAEHAFTFTEATSLLVKCANQAEVDRLWASLTEGGEEQPCGWLKDKFGVSWQIVPSALLEMLTDEDPQKAEAVTQAMLQMKKIDLQTLGKAYKQEAPYLPV